MKIRFHAGYLVISLVLLLTEVLIAVYVHDDIIRPYIGDFLVVILLYYFVRAFVSASVPAVALAVLLFSFLIEIGQYFHLVALLGLEHSVIAKVVLGNSFAWMDLLMYVAGIACVIFLEKMRLRSSLNDNK